MLTRQPNPRTSVEVREDPQEPAASSHVSLCPDSRVLRHRRCRHRGSGPADPVLLSLSSLARCSSNASMARSMASPWLWGPSRTSSPLALDSSLAGDGGAEDRSEASTRFKERTEEIGA
ncbi:hypothetical protein PAHAL_5G128400 [Panicum hallii]|uniref:Uncharacterized protein n=1 Tax=Panicum hallii TaxID=206008 RepID=A0A2T8IJU1_9POAL|nr:hypothetical protein PAHAL_5G128400 [Panicum hallii]